MSQQYKAIIPSEKDIKKNNKCCLRTITRNSGVKASVEIAPEEHLFVIDRVPSDFVNLVKYFYPAAKSIEEFWRMSKVTAYRNNNEQKADLLLSVSLDSFKHLVQKLKTKVEVKNPLFYGDPVEEISGALFWRFITCKFVKLNQSFFGTKGWGGSNVS
ncbi:hypothetical protein QNH36_03180 [Mesobacillus sp. AQ2]|uniref:hypothetical protein n=1 Tax=Mesobacillus sp. AQ2 TaxID=3043332 RepID=UPI0024C0F43E|nr:hypothetical protein [Mesobacillus sp. AQ2]WHX41183.1 hypothetical protein QNH36_03180 [Mesobacillus sp. AQ2]